MLSAPAAVLVRWCNITCCTADAMYWWQQTGCALQVVPSTLLPLLSAIYSNPLAAMLLPGVQAVLGPRISVLMPTIKQQLDAADALSQKKSQLLRAVKQLEELSRPNGGPGPAVQSAAAQAACEEVLACLPSLGLVALQEAEGVVQCLVRCSAACYEARTAAPAAPIAGLVTAVLAHPLPAIRCSAISSLAGETAVSSGAASLAAEQLVVGVLATIGLADEQLQPHVLQILQQAAALHSKRAGAALLAWQPWLACYKDLPAPIGPGISGLLQVAQQAPGAVLWHQLQPQLLDLFSSAPALGTYAASQLFSMVVVQPAAGPMPAVQFNLEPFSGMLVRAQNNWPAESSLAGHLGNRIATKLFSLDDVQGLIRAACNSNVAPDVAAQAFAQLAQVACDSRFHGLLGTEQGGLVHCQQCCRQTLFN